MNNYSENYKFSINGSISSKEILMDKNNLSNKNILEKDKSNNEFKYLNMEEYLCTELNDMDYDDAIKKDKRTFCEYFIERLKMNQIILNTFCSVDNLRPRVIKIILLILEIDLYLFINGLFFNEEYVSEIFHSNKEENFFTFVPRSFNRFFYTTLVGVIVGYIIDCFFIEEKKIKKLFIREKNNIIILKYEISQIVKNVHRRNSWFIFLSFIIISLTLYYIFCFNNVYPHMREEWIKSSIIIIIIMQILSILTCILEAIIRHFSFKCKSEKLYKISLLLS